MEAAGALGMAAPILESVPIPLGGAGWSWIGFGCVDAFQRKESGYPLRDFASRPRGVEPPSTRQLELQPAWDKGGILRPVQS